MSSLALNPIPLPFQARLVRGKNRQKYGPKEDDPLANNMTQEWVEGFGALQSIQAAASILLNRADLTDKNANFAATDISDGDLVAGLYEFLYMVTITTAAGVTSSITVVLDWTFRGATKTLTGTAVAGNTVGTVQCGGGLIYIDSNSPCRYSTIGYASNPALAMKYDLSAILRRVSV